MGSLENIEAASPELEEPHRESPSTELTLGIGSSFQATWPNHNKSLGDAKEISDPTQGEPHNNNMIMENLTLDDPAEKKSIDGSGRPTLDEGLAIHLDSNRRLHQEMDPKKLKRIMSNRLSAKRSRTRKNQHVAEMERQARYLETKIAILHPQVAAYEKQQRLLLIEQHQVKLRMATLERERVLKEVEMEKMKAEMNWLRALQRNKEQIQVPEMMRSWGADMKLMCNPSSNPCGLGPMVDTNSVQEAKNGEEPSEMQVATANLQRNKGKDKAKA